MSGRVSSQRDYDVVVIGTGIGGLTAAALLARLEGKRVLLLERHYRAGGFTHTFSRPGGFRWDVGVHYVGAEVVTPGLPGDAFRVASGGALCWNRMPDPFERLVFPGFELSLRAGRGNFVQDLTSAFPAEEGAIRAWLDDVDRVCGLLPLQVVSASVPALVRLALAAATQGRARLAGERTRDYLERRFADPRLRAVVGARWGDHGLPPGESAFLAHAVITRHYLEGAYYPVGSAARIAETMGQVIAKAGGEIRLGAEVEKILLEGGRAVGVRLRGGEELRAGAVISDAGARNTYLRLLPEEAKVPFRRRLAEEPPGTVMASLYLGLLASPATLGVRGENLWLHRGLDHDAAFAARGRVVEGHVDEAYVSFPSLKDPEARSHTAEILAVVDAASFQRWQGSRWMRRGEDYLAVKERVADALLGIAEERLPGLGKLVSHRELSTPLSCAHFTAHPGGEVYGLPWRPGPIRRPWWSARTPVKGLYLAGADAVFLGVVGAAMGGVAAASGVAGAGLLLRLRRAARELGEQRVAGEAVPAAAA